MPRKILPRAPAWAPRRTNAAAEAAASTAAAQVAYAALAVLVPALLLLSGLDAFPLRDNNEGLYAGIARAMLDSGELIVPQLNGVPYIGKPPLQYWLMALSMALFGPTAAAARLVGAAAMLGLCVALFHFCRRHGNARIGCYASIALASAAPVALIAHVVLFDPLLTGLLGSCLLCCLHNFLAPSRRALRLAAVLLGLAVLAKGALALLLAGGILGLFLLLERQRGGWRRLADPAALCILLAVVAPWHLAAALAQDGFAWFYFVNEHLLRFLGQRQPAGFHQGPPWYYLARLPAMLLPWAPLLLLLLRPRGASNGANRTVLRFCQAGVLFPLLFLSLSGAKADYYLLVAAPALALWLAMEVAPRVRAGADRRMALCWGMCAACALLALVLAPGGRTRIWNPQLLALAALGWMLAAAAASRAYAALRSLHGRELALLAVALASLPILDTLYDNAEARAAGDSSVQLARVLQEQPRTSRAVFIYRDFEDVFSTLPFYLGRSLPVIDSVSAGLAFGCKAAPARGCIGAEQFRRLAARAPVAVAVHAARAEQFRAMAGGLRWRTVRIGQKMLFFNSP